MPSLDEMKAMLAKGYAEAKQTARAEDENPALARTVYAKKRHRIAGTVMLMLGIVCAVINYLSYHATDRMLILLVAANIVFVFGGLWMILTGSNPFARFRR